LFILASFETTASVLQFLIYELAKNPQFQENILKEIEKMEKISYETIRDFKYLDAVIKETMRSVSKLQFYSRDLRFLKLIPTKDSIRLYQ